MAKNFFVLGCIFAFLGVAFGAFGSHALKKMLDAYQLSVFEIGVRYQMYHAFALLAVALSFTIWPSSLMVISGWLFVAGIVIFSGSLYVLSLSGITWLGAITPLGGLFLLSGWVSLAWAVWKAN